jgi:hypothetical protein
VYKLLVVLFPILAFIVNILIQVLTTRYLPITGLLKTIYIGFGMGGLSLFLMESVSYRSQGMSFVDFGATVVAHLLTYSALGYGYFHFINLGETARRVRILRELYSANTGLSKDQLLVRYNATIVIGNRINRLLASEQIIEKNGRYFINSPIMLLMSKSIIFMKYMLLGKRSEFD